MDQTPPAGGFRWDDIDQTIVGPKLSKLAAEMHEKFVKDEAQISFEGRKRGNSGYFLPTFLDKQVERTDEWARKECEIFCECWYEQGRSISPEFIRAIYPQALLTIFHVRKGAIDNHFARRAQMTGEHFNQLSLDNFARRIDVLANTWLRDLEAEAKALEHDLNELRRLSAEPASPQEARRMIVTCEFRLTEIGVQMEAHKQALTIATAGGGSVSKMLQEIRRLSERKTNFENLRDTLTKYETDAGEPGRTEEPSSGLANGKANATQARRGARVDSKRPRARSTSERVREQRIFAAIAKGRRGFEYCLDLKAQRIPTPLFWRSDGCPMEYPDAYAHPNPRWRALIQKEKYRYARKMERR
jgi:hypothetical protein